MKIKVVFFIHEWDNYQGGSSKVIEMCKLIEVDENIKISSVRDVVVKEINNLGYKDDWGNDSFSGRGIIYINII